MSVQEVALDPCHLHCRWNGKDMCLRCLLTPEAIAEHHLSLGVACGLRHIYYPNELPPCVHANGELDWHVSEWEDDEEEPICLEDLDLIAPARRQAAVLA